MNCIAGWNPKTEELGCSNAHGTPSADRIRMDMAQRLTIRFLRCQVCVTATPQAYEARLAPNLLAGPSLLFGAPDIGSEAIHALHP